MIRTDTPESVVAPYAAHQDDWPLRPWLLAGLLALAGLGVHLCGEWNAAEWTPWRAALASALAFGSLTFSFTVQRDRWQTPAIFAVLVALVMAGIAWRVVQAGDRYADAPLWLASGVVAIGLALPLFQAGFHRLRWRTAYDETHFHVWTDAIAVAGGLAFVGLSWLLLFLLGQLFAAIEISLLENLIAEDWFGWTFSGGAFGAALGVLRNQLKVIGTLQSVVMLVFSIIAVPLALALALFLLAVLASGISVLWNATESPTPLLLAVAAASLVLVNAVVRNDDAEASGNRVLRWAALVLALAILPLALLAAISTGTRIAEYGLSPERIWAVITVVVAVAYGLAYFIAPIRGRMTGWMARIRTANLHLAVGTCVLAFVLALPLFDFGAISARDQIARLESGKVTVEDFDFYALRWTFGDAGREALANLAKSENGAHAEKAQAALAQKVRPYRYADPVEPRDERLARLRIEGGDAEFRALAKDVVSENSYRCLKACVALDGGPAEGGERWIVFVEDGVVSRENYLPLDSVEPGSAKIAVEPAEAKVAQTPGSEVEIREWTGRRVYIDGQPAGQPFE